MEINDAIKTRILNFCAENKITINELAALSGLRATTIYSVISGKSKNPSFGTIKKICSGFGISIKDFFDDKIFNNIDT